MNILSSFWEIGIIKGANLRKKTSLKWLIQTKIGIWNDCFVCTRCVQTSGKESQREFWDFSSLSCNHAWQWAKPPCWIIGRQRKYFLLSKQTCLYIDSLFKFCKNTIVLFLVAAACRHGNCSANISCQANMCYQQLGLWGLLVDTDTPTCVLCHSGSRWGIPAKRHLTPSL